MTSLAAVVRSADDRHFRAAARRAEGSMVGVELVCSDLAEHRRRVESRTADVPGLVLPNWEKVVARDYSPWLDADLRMDTARTPPDVSAGRIRDLLQSGDAGASFDQVGTPDR